MGKQAKPGVRFCLRPAVLLVLVLVLPHFSAGYSVLTHEEIVDLLWLDRIRPLLLKRFPGTTDDELRKAHAYAYGGCMLQDMGYYPFGNKYFSDLVHYVRSGDFVDNLIEESSDLDEYAFALGALAHYASDTTGHPAVNRIVAMEFPKLEKKYGPSVTYANDHKAHIQTEFGLDMVQVAKNRFTSDAYHEFIGFEVSKPVLERAFVKTYGISPDQVFSDLDLSIGTYRRAISKVIPAMTKAALLTHKEQLVRETPNFDKKKFVFYLSRAHYERHWGTRYRRPSFVIRLLAFFLRFMPEVGPFKALAFKTPTTDAEDLYVKSVDQTVEEYGRLLREAEQQRLSLPNKDFDTGRTTYAGEYAPSDEAYARLLHELAQKGFAGISPELRANILDFYRNSNASLATKRHKKDWERTLEELNRLRAEDTSPPMNSPAQGPRGALIQP